MSVVPPVLQDGHCSFTQFFDALENAVAEWVLDLISELLARIELRTVGPGRSMPPISAYSMR
jgi:hypothetical protein